MAKYRKVYESDLQPVVDALSLFDGVGLTNPRKALASVHTVLTALQRFFESVQSRPVMEDET